jgi:DNA-binding cell septation regulator SpoVG
MTTLISDVEVRLVNSTGNLKASGKFVLAGAVEIKFTLVDAGKGLFVSLPRRSYERDGQTKWVNEVFITDKSLLQDLTEQAVASYNNLISRPDSPSTSEGASAKNRVPF